MKYWKKQVNEDKKAELIALIKETLMNEHILFAYVFGSFITEQMFNDIDIAVFVDLQKISPRTLLEYEIELEQKLSKNIKGYKLEIKTLNNAPVSFKYQVIKNGLPILVKDEDSMVDFETLTFSMYFDFEPLHRAYLKEVLNA